MVWAADAASVNRHRRHIDTKTQMHSKDGRGGCPHLITSARACTLTLVPEGRQDVYDRSIKKAYEI